MPDRLVTDPPTDRPARRRVLRASDDRGAVIPLVALVLPVIILMTAFSVDLGRQRDARRTAQARADVLSLDLVRAIDGRDTCTLIDDPEPYGDPLSIQGELDRSAARNDFDVSRVTDLVWGHLDAAGGFVAHHQPGQYPAEGCGFWPIPTSVRILTNDSVDYSFQPGTGDVNREAVANVVDERAAEFMLGSTLANLNTEQGWLLGSLLSEIIPGADLVGYTGLADATISLMDLAIALGLGSPEELLDADVTFEELMIASADALNASGGDAASVAVMNQLVGLGVQDAQVNMGEVLGLTTMDPNAALIGEVGLAQLLAAAIVAVDGDRLISIPDTFVNAAGLAGVSLRLHTIESARRVGTNHLSAGETSQIGLSLVIDLGVSGERNQRLCQLPSGERTLLGALLGGLFQFLNCLLAPLTSALLEIDVDGTVEIDLTVARVWAQQSIDCPDETLSITYDTGPVTAELGASLAVSVRFGGNPLTLLGAALNGPPVVSADGSSGTIHFDLLDEGPIHRDFEWRQNPTYFEDHGTARVGEPTLGLANLVQLGGLELTLLNASLPTLGNIARNVVQPIINDLLEEVDDVVLAEVSRLLGLNLGGADITPQWMHCDTGLRLVG